MILIVWERGNEIIKCIKKENIFSIINIHSINYESHVFVIN